MKLYVLTSGGILDGDFQIEGVFSTREKAVYAWAKLGRDCGIDEIELDEFRVARGHGLLPAHVETHKL